MSAARRKGTAWETAVVRYLNEHGWPHAERRALHGGLDKGDVTGIPTVVLECKNAKAITLGEWARELETEIANANAQTGALIIKRRQAPTSDAYAVLPLWRYVDLLKEAGH